MNTRLTKSVLVVSVGLTLSNSGLADEVKKTVDRTYENSSGNTVETHKRVTLDEEGDAKLSRQFEIVDPNGETVAVGRDREWERADGSQGSSQAAIRYDEDGNRILKRRQEQTNADGDTRSRNGKSVRDEDGNLTAKGINGQASKGGTEYKSQKRVRTNADGDTVTAVKRGKVDDQGAKKTVKKKTTKSKTAKSATKPRKSNN